MYWISSERAFVELECKLNVECKFLEGRGHNLFILGTEYLPSTMLGAMADPQEMFISST